MEIKYVTFEQTIYSLMALTEAEIIKEDDLKKYLDKLFFFPVRGDKEMIGYYGGQDNFRELRKDYLDGGLDAIRKA